MKKYFFAALALVALVACSKNNDGASEFDASKKSVAITVGNMASGVRAATAGGQTTGVTDETVACATVNDLIVLFADAGGNVILSKTMADAEASSTVDTSVPTGANCYVFHSLPENIAKVGVIANVASAPATLAAAKALCETETAQMIAAPYRTEGSKYGVVAYGEDLTLENVGECSVAGDHTKYPLLAADVEVKPHMARIEITHLACTDLATGDNKGYSHIGFTKLSLAGAGSTNAPYVHILGTFSSVDALATPGASYVVSAAHTHGSDTNYVAPADGKVWSWNIAPQATSDLTLDLYVKGDGYTVMVPQKSVTVNSYKKGSEAISQFQSGNIYRFAIDFREINIDSDSQYVCADVDVKIADWVINDVIVDFATPAVP